MVEILIINNNLRIVQKIKTLLEEEKNYNVTVLSSEKKGLDLLNEKSFDVIMLYFESSNINGLNISRRINQIRPEIPIILYSSCDIERFFNVFVESGVSCIISRLIEKEQLINAINAVLRGESIVSLNLLRQLRKIKEIPTNYKFRNKKFFSAKEIKILDYVARGKTNKEIASLIHLSPRTIEYHLTKIFRKLEVKSRDEAVIKMYDLS